MKAEPLMLGWLDLRTNKTDLSERIDLISSHAAVHLPSEGTAPFPVVLQFHGCAGMRQPFQEQWAEIANDSGFAAVIIDSLRPRGLSRNQAIETVCQGKELLGQERAGDVLAAIKLVEANPKLDETRITLAGWSHGAWTVMDFMTFDLEKKAPSGVRRADFEPYDLDGLILFYPHCARGARSRFATWTTTPKTLALIAGADSIVDAEACVTFFNRAAAKGAPIDLHIYPDTEHAFDDPFIEAEWRHWHHEENTEDAKLRYAAFLNSL